MRASLKTSGPAAAKSIGKNWICSILMRMMRKSTALSVVSVVKRTSVRRVTLNGRKPAQIGGTVSVRKG